MYLHSPTPVRHLIPKLSSSQEAATCAATQKRPSIEGSLPCSQEPSTGPCLLGPYYSVFIKKNLRGLSPRGNYTDWATAACRRSDCQLLRIEVPRGQRDRSLRPYSRFSRPEPLLFSLVAPQLYSRGWVDPVPDGLLLRESGSAGNWTRASGSVAKNSDH
jgi:hypothetical protein